MKVFSCLKDLQREGQSGYRVNKVAEIICIKLRILIYLRLVKIVFKCIIIYQVSFEISSDLEWIEFWKMHHLNVLTCFFMWFIFFW